MKYILPLILLLAVVACEEQELAVLDPSAAVNATASDSDVVLTSDMEGTDVLTVSWPEPDFGFSASPNYYVYLNSGSAEGDPIVINNAGTMTKTFKAEELNRHLLALGFEPEIAAPLEIWIESRLSSSKSIMSDVISVTATAYTSFLDLSTSWGVVGSGYNNWGAFPDAPFFSTKQANVLVAYVTLIDGHIKFRENNDWANNFGDNGGDGTLDGGGSDIPVTAGDYKITWNTQTNAYTIEKYSWGIVGSAYNDWGAAGPDFKFTYDDATDQWRAIVKLQEGAFKIRKNNDWGTNFGDSGADGTLEENGADMMTEGGKFLITFNENEKLVAIEPVPEIWGLVGSAYNNWGADGPDAQFTRDFRNDGVWVLKNVTLLDGAFKIRDDNNWATNYGDTGADGTLELNGTDISSQAGIYTITLNFSDPENPTWTSIKY